MIEYCDIFDESLYSRYGAKAVNLLKYKDKIETMRWLCLQEYEEFDADMLFWCNEWPRKPKFAVRSSSLLEDQSNRSFAGYFSTYLNVKIKDIGNRIQDIRCKYGAIPVLIQEMYSPPNGMYGVYFSVNPVTKDRPLIELYKKNVVGVSGTANPIDLNKFPHTNYLYQHFDYWFNKEKVDIEFGLRKPKSAIYDPCIVTLQVRPITTL